MATIAAANSPYGYTDFNTQAQDIEQNEAIARALLAQGLGPMPQPTNYGRLASPASPLAPIAQIVQSYFGAKGIGDAAAEKVKLNQVYQAALGQATKDYTSAPDRRTAAIRAMSSQFPQVAKMGQDEFTQFLKDQTSDKELLGMAANYDPSSVQKALTAKQAGDTNWQSLLLPKQDRRIVEGQVVNVTPGAEPSVIADVGRKYSLTTVPGVSGPLSAKIESGTGNIDVLDKSPKVNVTATSIMKGPAAGAEEIFRKGGETVSKLGEQARASASLRDNILRMKSLDERGVFSNKQQGLEALATNIAQGFGVPLSDELINKLSNTETFNSVGIKAWQDLVNQYGGNRGVTDLESKKIAQIVPQLSNSPQARAQLYEILQNAAERQINQFQEANAAFTEAVRQGKPELWQEQFGKVFAPKGSPGVVPGPGTYEQFKRPGTTKPPVSTDPFEQYKRKP